MLKLQRPGRIYLSGLVSLVCVAWIFFISVYYVLFWELGAATEGLGPRVALYTYHQFVYDGISLILAFSFALIGLLALIRENYGWAGKAQLVSLVLLLGHSALWMTSLGTFYAVQPYAWAIYLRYDLPPQAMLLAATVLTSVQISFIRIVHLITRSPRTI